MKPSSVQFQSEPPTSDPTPQPLDPHSSFHSRGTNTIPSSSPSSSVSPATSAVTSSGLISAYVTLRHIADKQCLIPIFPRQNTLVARTWTTPPHSPTRPHPSLLLVVRFARTPRVAATATTFSPPHPSTCVIHIPGDWVELLGPLTLLRILKSLPRITVASASSATPVVS